MEMYSPEVLITEEEIQLRVADLGMAITKDFMDEDLIVICVLKGAFVFCSDLIKKINRPVNLEFISLSSYGDSTNSSGNVRLDLDLTMNIEGRNVLIVEDIVDTGLTVKTLLDLIKVRKPKTLKLASLLYKPTKMKHDLKIDYLGFEIEDKFVIGYGLDYAGRYRELTYIGKLNAGN